MSDERWHHQWTAEEDATVISMCPGSTVHEILAALPGRSKDAIRMRAKKHGVVPRDGRATNHGNSVWSEDEIVELSALAGYLSVSQIADRMKRTPREINWAMQHHKLEGRGRVRRHSEAEVKKRLAGRDHDREWVQSMPDLDVDALRTDVSAIIAASLRKRG